MISTFVRVFLKDESAGEVNYINSTSDSYSLGYPCSNNKNCTPYILELKNGKYLFECWGSIGGDWNHKSTPGRGAYTSGILSLKDEKTFLYVYIGSIGFFNAITEVDIGDGVASWPGGATDVRLDSSNNWWDTQSLISRIMVAAGGGGAEWAESIGGNGGGIVGGESISATGVDNGVFEDPCEGATQISGSECNSHEFKELIGKAAAGTFGIAGIPEPTKNNGDDYGGFGGGGYYGGTSYGFAFAGSGGSSFISGHKGCNAVKNQTNIVHTGEPYHYSGYIFTHTKMISGSNPMPFPSNNSYGEYNGEGAFRITFLTELIQCTCKHQNYRFLFVSAFILFNS